MKPIVKSCAMVLGALLLPSCVPESKNPLSDPQAAKCDARLAGTWVSAEEKDGGWLHFIEAKQSMLDIVSVSGEPGEGADVCIYRMHVPPQVRRQPGGERQCEKRAPAGHEAGGVDAGIAGARYRQ